MIEYLPYNWMQFLFQAGEVALLAAGLLTVYANLMLRVLKVEMATAAQVVATALSAEADTEAAKLRAVAILAAAEVLALARLAKDARGE